MQVSAISAEYGQVSRALGSEKICNKREDYTNNPLCEQSASNKNTETSPDNIKKEIQIWKNFCHQQILKGKLDIIA